MNNARRTKIANIRSELQDICDRVQRLQQEEQDALDGIPENMSDRIDMAEQAVSHLDDTDALLNEAIYALDWIGGC